MFYCCKSYRSLKMVELSIGQVSAFLIANDMDWEFPSLASGISSIIIYPQWLRTLFEKLSIHCSDILFSVSTQMKIWVCLLSVVFCYRKLALFDEWNSLAVYVSMDNTVVIEDISESVFIILCVSQLYRGRSLSCRWDFNHRESKLQSNTLNLNKSNQGFCVLFCSFL